MSKDYIAEQIEWLDGIITDAENTSLFSGETHSAIQKELAERWTEENRLALLNDLSDRFGEEEVLAVIDKIIYTNCRKGWEQVGKEKSNSLDNFIKMLWGPLQEEGFEYSFEKEGNKICVNVENEFNKEKVDDKINRLHKEGNLHFVCLSNVLAPS